MIKLKSLLEMWEPADNDIFVVAEMNLPAEDDYQPDGGERLERVVWGVKKGQNIETHELDYLGLKGKGRGVYGIHISGDTDYWIDRLEQDYGRSRKEARIIEIIANEGDMLVEDPQYSTDPDTGIKASSYILLTKRKILRYGVDWVFRKF